MSVGVLSDSRSVGLFVTPWTEAPGSFVHGILQAGKNTGVGCHFFLQGIFLTQGSCLAGRFFTIWATREAYVHIYVCIYIYMNV